MKHKLAGCIALGLIGVATFSTIIIPLCCVVGIISICSDE